MEHLLGSQPRVLIVDDEDISRNEMMLKLEKGQMVVVGIPDSNSALMEAAKSLFDLILLDVEMPGINGFGLCARIRLLPSHRSTPVIFVSALQNLQSRASSRISGGNHSITKPVDFDELSLLAVTFIIKTRLRNALREKGNERWIEFR
jgi:DNA-binding response OmpR family regulator